MGGSEEDHPSYFVICFHRPCVQEAADFVVDSMVKPLEEGGAELIVRQEDGVDEKGKSLKISKLIFQGFSDPQNKGGAPKLPWANVL